MAGKNKKDISNYLSRFKHSWNEDVCKYCGVKKRTRTVFTQDMKMQKKVFDYFVNNEWVMKSPECKIIT